MLTQERLKEVLFYDGQNLIWRVSTGPRSVVWRIAGHITWDGYRKIVVDKANYHAHRLIWLYTYGSFPKNQIDHINGVRDDNRLDNLE